MLFQQARRQINAIRAKVKTNAPTELDKNSTLAELKARIDKIPSIRDMGSDLHQVVRTPVKGDKHVQEGTEVSDKKPKRLPNGIPFRATTTLSTPYLLLYHRLKTRLLKTFTFKSLDEVAGPVMEESLSQGQKNFDGVFKAICGLVVLSSGAVDGDGVWKPESLTIGSGEQEEDVQTPLTSLDDAFNIAFAKVQEDQPEQ